MIRRTEVAVIGIGAMGAHALWRLATRGVQATGFERFSVGHAQGSSHGDTRIFRTAYLEDPAYVPLLQAALPLWRDLERQSGEELLKLNGGLMIGPERSLTVQGALLSARMYGLEYELLNGRSVAQRYPQHVLDTGDCAVHEPMAGYLRPERAVRAAARRAVELGATINEFTEVIHLRADNGIARISTSDGEWIADRVILCAGAWIPKLIPEAHLPLAVERVAMVWHEVEDPSLYSPDRFPIWIHELADGSVCYGFPSTDGRTAKVATHHRGRTVDPDHVDRTVHPGDIAHVEDFIRQRTRGLMTDAVESQICLYTNTRDYHFAIGELPGHPEIILVSACSGHGFKFATSIGEVAAQLATAGSTSFDLSFFDPQRLVTAAATSRTESEV